MNWLKRLGTYVLAILIAFAIMDGALELYVRSHFPHIPTVPESLR